MKNLSNNRVVWGQEIVYDVPCHVPAWLGHWVSRDLVKCYFEYVWASLIAQLVKNPPGMQEALVRFLDWEDHLEKDRLPTPVFWSREFHGLYSPWDCKELDMTEWLSLPWVHKLHDMLCLGSSPRFLCSLNSKLNWGPEFLTDNPESVISADLK